MLSLPVSSNAGGAAANNLQVSTRGLEKSLQRLSSGSRLSNTADDAAGSAVHAKLAAALKRISAVETNLMNAESFVRVQDDALKSIGDLLTRMSELKVLAQDPTKNRDDISNYATEYWQLSAQIRETGRRKFNGIPLFSSTDQEEFLQCRSREDGGQMIPLVLPPLKQPSLLEVFGQHIYKVISSNKDWYDAQEEAEASGGHLATIASCKEWEEIQWQLGLPALTKDPLWIGLQQAPMAPEPSDGWGWVTGEALDCKRWMNAQPDNGGNLAPNPAADGLAWNQAPPCVVKGHMGDEVMANSDNTVTGYIIEYTAANGTTKYLAVRNNPMSWDAARLAAYDAKTVDQDPVNGVLPSGATNPRLATLQTAAQVDAAKQQISNEQGVPRNEILWLGGYQALPSGVVESMSNVREYWHWISDTKPSTIPPDPNPVTDETLNWRTLYPHGGQPNNISSAVPTEDVGYMSGPFGEWADSTSDPTQNGIKGYLFEKDIQFEDIPLSGIEKTLEWVAHYRAVCGAESSRIRFAHEGAQTARVNLESADSKIVDADVAQETILMARNKVLVESGAKMLQTANESLQVILKLLGS